MTVIIGMDPHKRSATIEIIDLTGKILATGRYNTGYGEILTTAEGYTDRVGQSRAAQGRSRSELITVGMLADRRDELGRARTDTVNRLLLELLPGGARKLLTAMQARKMVATAKPVELIGELESIDRKPKRQT